MKITVDVLKVEQSHDLNTGEAQNYLVFSLFGTVHRVPCAAEVVIAAVQEAAVSRARGKEPAAMNLHTPSADQPENYAEALERSEDSRVEGQSLFIGGSSPDLDLSDLNLAKAPAAGGEPVRRPLQISRAPRVVQPPPVAAAPAPVARKEAMADDAGIAQG